MRTLVRRSLAVCLLLAAACGGSRGAATQSGARPRARTDHITLEEISRVQGPTASLPWSCGRP